MDAARRIVSILTEPKHTRWIAPCLILAEVVLCALIVFKVQYTEIDYTTYLQQAEQFLNGERNYVKIRGASGPLVYPAIHVYIFSALNYLTIERDPKILKNLRTDTAVDIGTSQLIFGLLYILTLALVIKCYRNVNAPPWLLACLVLSKRLHSIFLLRLFNDAWAAFAFWLSISLFQKRRYFAGAVIWSLGVGIKMTILLAVPAIGAILVHTMGPGKSIMTGLVCLLIHIAAAWPFIAAGYTVEYVARAFEFGRVFLYKWTVNWRFIDEDTFLSRQFTVSLLIIHASLIVLFLHWKWLRPSSRGLPDFINKLLTSQFNKEALHNYRTKISPTFVMDTMLGSTAIGLLCARSLHYQFFAYLGWASPYLLWRAGGGPVWVVLNWAIQEYCWLVFPSTELSSAVVVLELTLQVVSTLISPPVDHISPPIKVQRAPG